MLLIVADGFQDNLPNYEPGSGVITIILLSCRF